MTTKKQTRKVQKPAKEGTIPRDVVEAAVKAVSGKATEQVKKPTIKSLQQEVAFLKEQLDLTSNLAENLEMDLIKEKSESSRYAELHLNEVSRTSQLTSKIKELENRSIFAQILFALSKPFK